MSRLNSIAATTLTAVVVLTIGAHAARADQPCGHCTSCGQSWKWVEVEQEYLVRVPYTEQVERTITVSVPHVEQVEHSYTVMVPQSEVRTGTRTIQKCIPETKAVTVSRDFGRWVTPLAATPCTTPCTTACTTPCGCADGCGLDCHHEVACNCPPPADCVRVWVPDVRTKDIAVTTHRTVTEEVPYEYTATEFHPEQRTKMVDIVRYTTEERQQQMNVTRYREETRTRTICIRQPNCACGAPVCGACE